MPAHAVSLPRVVICEKRRCTAQNDDALAVRVLESFTGLIPKGEGDGTGESRPVAYFFSSTTTVWVSVFPVFSTAIDSALLHHTSPAFLVLVAVFPSDPVTLTVPGAIA